MIFAAQLFSLEDLLPFAVFGMFAALAWWALELVAAGKSRAVERLDELKDPLARRKKADTSALKKQDAMTKVLEKASPALAKPTITRSILHKERTIHQLRHFRQLGDVQRVHNCGMPKAVFTLESQIDGFVNIV